MPRYTGEGRNIQEALDQAIAQAKADTGSTHPLVHWSMVNTSGESGGWLNQNVFRVEIDAVEKSAE